MLNPPFRRTAAFIPSGVAVLSTNEVAMTVSSLNCVSFDPPMISVAVARNSSKASLILKSTRFHARVLRNGEEAFAKGGELPPGAGLAEMECVITAIYPAGDHHLVLAAVASTSTSDGYPLVWWRRGLHEFQPRYSFLASREAFEEFVAAWEGGRLPKPQ